jgi:D-3-phosphoglycerate dehydrogenase / 2-oxoglutarate reductase
MPEVLVVGRIKPEGMAILEARGGLSVRLAEESDPAAILAAAPTADAILVRTAPIGADVIAAAQRLRVVSRHGVGYDNVDVAALDARRIPLAVSANANRVSVAEHAMAMLLTLAKAALPHDAAVRAGNWAIRNRFLAFELFGKQLLLVGFGRIGREVAARARAFGMTVAVHDPFVDAAALEASGCTLAPDLDEALRTADAVSLHLPLSTATRHVIDARRLALMRPTAILLNTARGGLIDEHALAAALAEGALRAAGIDVFAEEPPRPDNPLLASANVLLSPHNAGVTDESMVRMATEAATNILDVLDGRLDPGVIVNLAAIAEA